MSNSHQPVVTEAAYLTLHYRLCSANGVDLVTTFNDGPATIQLGSGQLAPFLEACLIGLPDGAQEAFDFSPEEAFGVRNPDLVQRVSRATLRQSLTSKLEYNPGDVIQFDGPSGRITGLLREINEAGALLDFNHPLAGQSLKFEVKIIGIL